MKKVTTAALFFFCVIFFAAAPPVFANDGATAEMASAGGEDDMREFLLHLKRHRTQSMSDDRRVEFRNSWRLNNGVWRHDDTYVIIVNGSVGEEGTNSSALPGDIIFFHAKYPSAGSGSLRGIQIFRELMTEVEKADGEAVCVRDSTGKYGNHICAVEDYHMSQSGALSSSIQIVGFNHELNEVDHSKALDSCPKFTAEELRNRGWLSADMVNDEESLVRYLEGVVKHVSEQLDHAQQSGEVSLVRMIELLSPLMPCWRTEPWESGSIYFYIVTDTKEMFGIFNGNTPQLQGSTLLLVDDNGHRIAELILEEVNREDNTPNRGFLTYLWDDPTVTGDEVVCEQTGPVPGPTLEDKELFCEAGNPIPGRSPGTSVKRGYFIRTDFGVAQAHYVVGSGIYPKSRESSGGGGGCAIVSESSNRPDVGAFNLFLITVALFLAAASGKRCTVAKLLPLNLRRKKG